MKAPNNCIELKCFWTWMGDDGVVRTKVKPDSEVVLEDAKENSIAVNSFSGTKYSMLVDTREIKSITKEARNHFSMNNRESKVVAFAMLIKSPLSKVIANFFLGLNKPRVPVKIFTNEKKAIDWCKTYLN
ncbi:MAG: hypothetical protein KDD29_05465 [Flavobacteriales bacterium]|nr:hypothetical protein [Flavobacteriales bacterium]